MTLPDVRLTSSRLGGRVALVTGGSRGIGASVCRRLARDGATVVVVYSTGAEEAASVVASITDVGGRAEAARADVRDTAAVNALVAAVVKQHGRLDVLVNNAGVTRDTLLAVMTDDEWDAVLDVNLKGAFRMCRAACKPMLLARRGRIINVSSVAGQKGGRGHANYVASKAGLEGMTRALAAEMASRGVTVNAVAPGIIVTAMTEQIRQRADDEAKSKILLGRYGTPDDVAAAVAFLASDDASYITGAVLPVDGGFKMG